jgi:hypothetical protein
MCGGYSPGVLRPSNAHLAIISTENAVIVIPVMIKVSHITHTRVNILIYNNTYNYNTNTNTNTYNYNTNTYNYNTNTYNDNTYNATTTTTHLSSLQCNNSKTQRGKQLHCSPSVAIKN